MTTTSARTILFALVGLGMAVGGGVAAADEPVAGKVTYDKGFKLATDDGKFELKLNGRVMSRWELMRTDEDAAEFSNRFLIARGRLSMTGKAYNVGFKVQSDFGRG